MAVSQGRTKTGAVAAITPDRSHLATGNWHLFPSVGLYAVVFYWFVTYGTGNLFQPTPPSHLESVYEGLAERLAQGSFDIVPDAIQGEAFLINGRYYTYFPPAPALPRIVLNRLWPQMYGEWSKAFSLLFGVVTLLGTVALYRAWRDCVCGPGTLPRDRWLELLLIACAGFGSTLLWLGSKAIVYHEAPLWAVGLALWSTVFTVRFWTSGKNRYLVSAGVLAFFAFFARSSSALGAFGLLAATAGLLVLKANTTRLPAWLARRVAGPPQVRNWRTPVSLIIGVIAVTGGVYLWYNWVRWGNAFDAQPLRYNIAYMGGRIEHIHGSIFNLAAIPRNFLNYWVAPSISWGPAFPWVRFGETWLGETDAIPYAYFEQHASIAASSSALLVFFLAGLASAIQKVSSDIRPLLLAGSLFAGSVPLLAYVALCHRYNHDLYPALAAGACIALVALRGAGRCIFGAAVAALALLSVYSAFVTLSLAWVFQRDLMFAMPEARRAQLSRISRGVDIVTGGFMTPVRFAGVDPSCALKIEPDGQRFRIFDCETRSWRSIPKPIKVELDVQIPGGRTGLREPLLTVGAANSAERIFLAYEEGDRLHIGHDHWGSPAVVSDAIRAAAGDTLQMTLVLDSVRDEVHISVNGREVLTEIRRLHDWGDGGPLLGANPLDSGIVSGFSGKLTVKSY